MKTPIPLIARLIGAHDARLYNTYNMYVAELDDEIKLRHLTLKRGHKYCSLQARKSEYNGFVTWDEQPGTVKSDVWIKPEHIQRITSDCIVWTSYPKHRYWYKVYCRDIVIQHLCEYRLTDKKTLAMKFGSIT